MFLFIISIERTLNLSLICILSHMIGENNSVVIREKSLLEAIKQEQGLWDYWLSSNERFHFQIIMQYEISIMLERGSRLKWRCVCFSQERAFALCVTEQKRKSP